MTTAVTVVLEVEDGAGSRPGTRGVALRSGRNPSRRAVGAWRGRRRRAGCRRASGRRPRWPTVRSARSGRWRPAGGVIGASLVGIVAMLSCCYILITNDAHSGKWGVKTLALMQETSAGRWHSAPVCRCIGSCFSCCTTRSPAARSLPATRCPPSSRSASSSGCLASPCGGPWPIWPTRATSNVGKAWDPSSGDAIGPTRHRRAGSYMDNLRQTQFQTSVDVVEYDTPIAAARDRRWRWASTPTCCTSCGSVVSAERASR